MIHVCDSIMGSGKSSAAITYMNEHSHDKFVYITPYLEEAKRIRDNCPAMRFTEPSNRIQQYEFSKVKHTAALIEEGRNIATTHQAFKSYTPDMLERIREFGYTLIIDESVDVLELSSIHPDDLKLIVDAGYVKFENGEYRLADESYSGNAYAEVFSMLRSHALMQSIDDNSETLYYWVLSPDLITSFRDVFVLTYLFNGQGLQQMFRMCGLGYDKIGTIRRSDGTYSFGKRGEYTPPYVAELASKIHILDNPKMNEIGSVPFSLSLNWFGRSPDLIPKLKSNLSNYFNNIYRTSPLSDKMWGTYKAVFQKLKGQGYTKAFVTFNAKATNEFMNRRILAYPVNIFMNSNEKVFYERRGLSVDEDMYALSIMTQWIWRSAIRNGEDISIYIPSERMRELLRGWMSFCSGKGVTSR